jgi:hypothetical protein
MLVHTFHLATPGIAKTVRALVRPPKAAGLRHAECMTIMQLGSPILSPSRLQLRRLAMFASWERETAIDGFLAETPLGRSLAQGWHVRLELLRQWGHVSEFDGLSTSAEEKNLNEPVVALTLARLKIPQVPRFIRWGKPVEELVRDHPATTLAVAAMRPVRTVSTFSIWRTAREMTEMVHGTSDASQSERHADAMVERRRKDFHYEFTTLRFRSLGEYGEWNGRGDYVPAVSQ